LIRDLFWENILFDGKIPSKDAWNKSDSDPNATGVARVNHPDGSSSAITLAVTRISYTWQEATTVSQHFNYSILVAIVTQVRSDWQAGATSRRCV